MRAIVSIDPTDDLIGQPNEPIALAPLRIVEKLAPKKTAPAKR